MRAGTVLDEFAVAGAKLYAAGWASRGAGNLSAVVNAEAADALIRGYERTGAGRSRHFASRMRGREIVAGLEPAGTARTPFGRPEEPFLITASGSRLGEMGEADVVLCVPAGDGEVEIYAVEGKKPSMELMLHAAALAGAERRGVKHPAAAHAHPLYCAVAHLVAGVPDVARALEAIHTETAYFLPGGIGIAADALPGSEELASSVREAMEHADAVVMPRHGAVAVGEGLREAVERLEALERAAHLLWLVRAGGGRPPGQ